MFRNLFPVVFLATPAFAEVGACPIEADFITEPEILETTQQLGPVAVANTTKRAFVDGAMVQIECTEISPDQVFPGQDDGTILANYVRYWSINETGPAKPATEPVDHYVIEGTKNIQGFEVTYTYRLFRFANNFAMVATAVPNGGQPPDVRRFLASLRIDMPAPQPFTEAEMAQGKRAHIAACLPAASADNETRKLGLSTIELTYFCSCTGQRYFSEFTRSELRSLAFGDDASVEQRRQKIQNECFEEAVR